MKRLLAASIALILASGIIACDTGPTGPEADLVGTWTFEGTDLIEVFSQRFEAFLVNQGWSRTGAKAFVDVAFADAEEYVRNLRSMERYNADSTWEDNHGNKGTWRIEDDDLIITNEDGAITRARYFLDGDDLTIIFTKAQFLAILRQAEDFDAAVYEMYKEILDENDVVRFFYKRKS